ncbi:MAG: helix-turn-helix transcriptional regulator [Dehalococcoidia bacterium]|nr:helix-turn-helix transcriptional regulator [Dehalococcoidia bacterium]
MTPIKQGLYEFKKESLIEARKAMGVTQNKMAELLGVPANTLSRWETGATAPDATSLAAIVSLMKEHGLTPPVFFGIRSTTPELKLSSKPSDQSGDWIGSYNSLRNYLTAQIELEGAENAPVVKVEIRNTAPESPEWPKVVFTGVGLSLGYTAKNISLRGRDTKMTTKLPEKAPETATTPWVNSSKIQDLRRITYSRTDQKEFPRVTPDEQQHGEVLFPGECVVYELNVTTDILPYVQFKIEGTISRRHLLHCEEIFAMPEHITRAPALSALTDLNAIDIHEPLKSVIALMPKFDENTKFPEVQNFTAIVSNTITGISSIQEEVTKIYRRHKFSWFLSHMIVVNMHLENVKTALVRMKEAMDSGSPDRTNAASSAILAMRMEASQVNRETEELMRKHNISDEEVKYRYRGQ